MASTRGLKILAVALVAGLWSTTDGAQDAGENKADAKPAEKSFTQRVEEAIDRGCDWLKKQQGIEEGENPAVFGRYPVGPRKYAEGEPHRYRLARTAFPVQALCKSGVFADDPVIVKAMEYLRKNYVERGVIQYLPPAESSMTYEDATVLHAVEAYYLSIYEAKERGLDSPEKRFTKDGQGNKVPIKRWGTEQAGAQKAKEQRKKRPRPNLSVEDRRVCDLAVKALIARFRKAYDAGGWRYDTPNFGQRDPDVDCSATQYALMGLMCATRLGLEYDKGVLFDVFRLYEAEQDKDGPSAAEPEAEGAGKPDKTTRSYWPAAKDKARGWGYSRRDAKPANATSCGSMTAAGVCALVMLRNELEDDAKLKARWKPFAAPCEQMISDGLAWLVRHWTLAENPKRGKDRYYFYLYMVERLGMLGGIDKIGSHDWYYEGADEHILKHQEVGGPNDGMWDVQWEADPSDIYNTCYALLFLKRGTDAIDRPKPVYTGKRD